MGFSLGSSVIAEAGHSPTIIGFLPFPWVDFLGGESYPNQYCSNLRARRPRVRVQIPGKLTHDSLLEIESPGRSRKVDLLRIGSRGRLRHVDLLETP